MDGPDTQTAETDEQEIKSLIARLARPHPSGGVVVERAAILAGGCDATAVMGWITAHDGEAEAVAVSAPRRGLHGARMDSGAALRAPSRFVLPRAALD